MAREIEIFDRSLPASADLSASQFCAVIIDSSGNAALPSAAGAIYGVLQNKPSAAGRVSDIRVLGLTKMYAGTNGVTKGDLLTVENTGKCITAASSGRYVIGWAEETAAVNTLTSVLLLPQGKN